MKTGFAPRHKQSLKEQPVRRVSQKIFIHCGLVIMLMAVNISNTDASSPCKPDQICVTGPRTTPLGNPLESLQDEYLMPGDEYADMDVGLDPGAGEDLAQKDTRPDGCATTTYGNIAVTGTSSETDRYNAAQLAYNRERTKYLNKYKGGDPYEVTYADGSSQIWNIRQTQPSTLSNVPRTQPTPADANKAAACAPKV
jgi:hypothetical protein